MGNGASETAIHLLSFALDNDSANLRCGLDRVMLLVRVVELLQASGALCAVCSLKTAMQTVIPHAVAIAIAGLLMEHHGYLCGQIVGVGLVWILSVGAPELIFSEDCRELRPFWRRPGIESGRSAFLRAG